MSKRRPPKGTPLPALPPLPPLRKTHLKLTLVENGVDFVRSGIERYFLRDTPAPRDHKYAVLHVFAGALLLMKARLAKEHPSLIFVKVEELGRSDAVTVNFRQVIDRLRAIAGVDLQPFMATLELAQKTRNNLEHYEVSLALKDTQELVGRLCTFVFLFLRDELGEQLEAHLKGAVWNRVVQLRGIADAIVEGRRKQWLVKVSKYEKLTVEQLDALWDAAEAGANGDGRVYSGDCPECGEQRIIRVDDDLLICTNSDCREAFRPDECLRCDRLILAGHDVFCEECRDYVDAQ
jgi:hypothetical protein